MTVNNELIKDFFNIFLRDIVKELEQDGHNSELMLLRTRCFREFINNNSVDINNNEPFILANNLSLINYANTFDLQKHYHNIANNSRYVSLTEYEKEREHQTNMSMKNYPNIPKDYNIHDVINSIGREDIPLLVHFFNTHTELFETFVKQFEDI